MCFPGCAAPQAECAKANKRGCAVKSQGMCFAICGALALAGCGSKQDANEKNFAGAISQALEKGNELCLGLFIKQWPVKVWVDAPRGGIGKTQFEQTVTLTPDGWGRPLAGLRRWNRRKGNV